MDALTLHTLKLREDPFGADLLMVDLQRGRERGVTGYTAYLELCTGLKVTSFEDLVRLRITPRHVVDLFAQLYE